MNIYENNKQLLNTMGGDSYNLATDFEVRKAILDLLGGDSSTCNSIYEVDKQILNIYLEGGGGTGGEKAKVTSFSINADCIVDGTWNADVIDTSNVTSMASNFRNYTSLQSLNLSGWDTSKVKSMYYMFDGCRNLQSVGDISGWDTSKVTNMERMFGACNSLQSVGDISGWDTSNVKSMNGVFDGCSSLTNLDLSGWDTSNVSDIRYMFDGCSSLTNLDVSGWDTSRVNDMDGMFNNCSSLTNLDLSGWDTSKVTNMNGVFDGCRNLQSVGDISGWDTSKVTNMNNMFEYCRNLQSVDLSGFDVSNVTTMNSAFNECGKNYGSFNSVGGRTIEEVISGNVGILNGLKITVNSYAIGQFLDRASLRALINGIADLTGSTSQTLHLSSLKAKLTTEDIAIATAKNWTISSY